MKKTYLWGALLLLPFFVGAKQPATYVTIIPAKELLFKPEFSISASVVAKSHALVPAQLSAQVLSVAPDVGDKVNAEDIIAELECVKPKLSLEQIDAVLSELRTRKTFALAQQKRTLQLKSNKHAAELDVEQQSMNVGVLKSQIKAQEVMRHQVLEDIENCVIKAPFTGVVTQKLVSKGEMVSPGTPVVKVLETASLNLMADVPLAMVDDFLEGEGYNYQGTATEELLEFKEVLPMVDAQKQSRKAVFEISGEQVLSGEKGQLKWRSKKNYLPPHLLVQRDNQLGIFILENELAKYMIVQNAKEGHPFLSPVSEIASIVVDGRHSLIDGNTVALESQGQ